MTHLIIIPSITNYFTFLEEVARELRQRGDRVLIATNTKHITRVDDCYDRPLHGEHIQVDFPRGFNFIAHLKAARAVERIVAEHRPDLIMVHFSAAIFTTALAKKNDWPRTIGMMHGLVHPLKDGAKKWAITQAECWSAEKMDLIVLLNKEDKDILAQHIDPRRIHVTESFGLGCDIDRFDPIVITEETKTRFLRRLSVRKEDFVFIFVGRQVDFKGFDRLVRAFLDCYEDHKCLKLVLVGAKDNIHPTDLSKEEEAAMRHCPGIIDVGWKENVHEYLTVADVNVFPSKREGMPVNLMESIAMGVPVITTDSRGCRDVVDHDRTGLLVADNSVAQIRDKMLELYHDRDKLDRLKEGCRQKRHLFDRRFFVEEQMGIFDRMTQKKSTARMAAVQDLV